METVSFILVYIRSILYPIIAFLLLVAAFSANRIHAKMFRIVILISCIFMILGIMAAVRLVYNSTEIISNIGNFTLTPLLTLLGVFLVRMALGEEKRFIKEMKKMKGIENESTTH